MAREFISTLHAPAAIGTYSQAVKSGGTLYISGQIPLVPATMTLVDGEIDAQVRQVFSNLAAICKAAGTSIQEALKFNIYLTDLSCFNTVNEIMEELLQSPYPARAVIEASALPKGVSVEIDAIVACPD